MLAAFQLGFNLADTNLPEPYIRCWIQETEDPDQFLINNVTCEDAATDGQIKNTTLNLILDKSTAKWSIAISIYALGAMAGSLIAGPIANKVGRKPSILLNAILNAVSCITLVFIRTINSYYVFVVLRVLLGVNTGWCSVVTPLYLGEISPKKLSSTFVASFQLTVCVGQLVAQVFGLSWILGTDAFWPLCLGLSAVPGLIQIGLYFFVVETPGWLVLQGRISEAKLSNESTKNEKLVESGDSGADSDSTLQNIKKIFKNPALRGALMVTIIYHLAQQLSGINAIIFYSGSIFTDAGVPPEFSGLATCGVGAINIAGVALAIFLINKVGRISLFVTGLVIMSLMSVSVTILLSFPDNAVLGYLVIAPVLIYVFAFELGPGPLPWMMSGEYMPIEYSAGSQAIGAVFNWFGCFVVGLIFPPLQSAIGQYSFMLFAATCALFAVLVKVYGVESRKKTVEQVQMVFRKRAGGPG